MAALPGAWAVVLRSPRETQQDYCGECSAQSGRSLLGGRGGVMMASQISFSVSGSFTPFERAISISSHRSAASSSSSLSASKCWQVRFIASQTASNALSKISLSRGSNSVFGDLLKDIPTFSKSSFSWGHLVVEHDVK